MSRPRRKSQHEPAPQTQATRNEAVPLTAEQRAKVDKLACGLFTPAGGQVVREPVDNVYGPYKVLQRTDNLWAMHDTRARVMGQGQVFLTENGARTWAKENGEHKT